MEVVTGIFGSRAAAEAAAHALWDKGWPANRAQVLYPSSQEPDEAGVPVEDTEQPGVAAAVGGVVGGAAGLGLGVTLASLALPGLGTLAGPGLAAAALLGAGGAAGGAVAANALEEKSQTGLPRDEIYLYEDALVHGKSVVFAEAASDEDARVARQALEAAGAESLDAARESWWIGLRDAEKAHYQSLGHSNWFAAEPVYRRGFTAARDPNLRGKSWDSARVLLREQHGRFVDDDAFRIGYERGGRQPEKSS